MQNKVLQAMAAELPVVATTVANEGIGAAPGTEIVLRDDVEGFAAAVIELLRNEATRTRIGRAGRRFLEEHWTWEAHFLKEERIFEEVAGMKEPSSILPA
jgi:glycosyltransferase involved in cell wall biosynthesis